MQEPNEKIITCLHSNACGDMISLMAGMKAHYERNGLKWRIYQRINMPAVYYDGCVYGTLSETKSPVTMNEHLFRMLRPLIVSQEYVDDFLVYMNHPVDVNFDKMYELGRCNKPYGMIQRWPFYCYHDLAIDCDLSQPWLDIPPVYVTDGKIVINRTQRYNNPAINYSFLKEYENDCVFVGTDTEHKVFVEQYGLDIKYLAVHNFYELACLIKGAKVFLGSQSMCWNIAEATKVPRIVEVFKEAPNCIPVGKNGYDAMSTTAMKAYVEYLFNKK